MELEYRLLHSQASAAQAVASHLALCRDGGIYGGVTRCLHVHLRFPGQGGTLRSQSPQHSSPQVLICVTGPEEDQWLVRKPVLNSICWHMVQGCRCQTASSTFMKGVCVCVCVFQTCAFHNTFSLTRASLLGAEPCVDIWPPIEHRRVRNERTGRRDCKTGFCEQLQASTLQGLFCSYCQMLRCGLQVGSIHSGPVPCFHSFKVLFACTYRRCRLGKHCG